MPIPAKIEHLQSIGVLRCQRHAWFVGIGRNGRSRQRIGQGQSRQNIGWNLTPRSAFAKAKAEKFRLKNTFADGDGITRLDAKTSALSLGEALRINLENLIPAGGHVVARLFVPAQRCAYIHQP